jgi:formamidopyrimidine-DNA glycosylase
MPELPEVETIVRSLRDGTRHCGLNVIGQQVRAATVLWERTLENISPQIFQQKIAGQTVENIHRRGKFLVFTLNRDTMLVHLRMSGDLRVEAGFYPDGNTIALQPHDRLVLWFASGQRMAFNNPRKFGRVWLTDTPQEVLGVLGPEPLDETLTDQQFHAMLLAYKRMLKPLLMDQHFLAGMGNIYTDEALFRAKLHPRTISNTLTQPRSTLLLQEMRKVLKEGIQRNGASIDWVYRGGDFQNDFNVYGRAGEACPRCGTEIVRMLVGQRGTHICPNCQQK